MEKKIIRAGEKNNLAPILSEKNTLARTKNPSPPPPLNIKRTVPYQQDVGIMDINCPDFICWGLQGSPVFVYSYAKLQKHVLPSKSPMDPCSV